MGLLRARRQARRSSLRADRPALVCGVLAVLLLGGALGLVLSRSAQHRSGTNGVFQEEVVLAGPGTVACQGGELVPAGTGTVQISGLSGTPPIVVLRRAGRVLERVQGTVDPRAQVIRAPIERADRDLDGVRVCLHLQARSALARGPSPPGVGTLVADQRYPDSSLVISYLMPGQRSWWQLATTIVDRIGRNGIHRMAWVVAGFVAASLVLTAWIVLRTIVRDRPFPRLGAAIAAVAVLNAAAWSLVTPAFQIPDEVGHVAYVQALGETGRALAHPPALTISREQATAMADSGYGAVGRDAFRAAAWSRWQQHGLPARDRPLDRRQTIPIGEAEPEPPLYYALETIPYRVAHGAALLDRMALMRLFSALLAGVTALMCFQFVRECLPGKPWAWTVGGLGVALAPMLGFMAGGISPDAQVFALSSALFLCVARAWRRGATTRRALGIGALLAAGMLTKVSFYGLVPGALLALALAAHRTTLAWDRRVVRTVATAALLAVGLFAAGAAFEALAWHRSIFAARPRAPESHVGLLSHLGYVWQVYLPRLPFQAPTALTAPGYEQLFRGFVGAFGPLMVWFPTWVYRLAAIVLALVTLLAVRSLHVDRRELRWRRIELLGYAAAAAGLLLLIGLSADLRRNLIVTMQGRYLLPLLPLFGVLLALGARGAGERWGRCAGVAIVSGAVAWSVFGQLLTIAWFYG
jgi:hypothetical protein